MTSSEAPHTKLLPNHFSSPYGSPEALENLGTAAAPLLAGFAFALIGLLLDKGAVMWNPDLALLLLVLSGLLLVFAVECAFNARCFHVPPGDYLSFLAIAAADKFPESKLREEQVTWHHQHEVWANFALRRRA